MIRPPVAIWMRSLQRSTLVILAACLLLGGYIGFLMVSNYRSQMELRESVMKRFRLDLEKRAATLEYFFSERKYDLKSLAASREVSAYFTNKALGMSEQYGLKVNLFMIGQILERSLSEKSIGKDPIYSRLLLMDRNGRFLSDTGSAEERDSTLFRYASMMPEEKEPTVFTEAVDGNIRILMIVSCFHKDQPAGRMIAWLSLETLFGHFVNMSPILSGKGFDLTTPDGRIICPEDRRESLSAGGLTPARIASLSEADITQAALFRGDGVVEEMLMTRLPIQHTPLHLLARAPETEMLGAVTPWKLLAGTASLAIVMLLGIGVMAQTSMRHMILKIRFDESKRRQDLLAEKNRQLNDEIDRRQQAETELENQRSLQMRSDRLRSLGEMAAGIAHELNQPLVGVRGLAELMLILTENDEPLPPKDIRNRLETIVAQADRMVHIINHVRLFARDAGKMETSRVDLNDVVRSGMSLLTAQFKSHGLMLENFLYPQALPVRVNPYSIEEVILNLLSNARDAVETRARSAGPRYIPHITVSTWNGADTGDHRVWLKVSDNGAGISPEVAGKVFDPFFTTKDPDKGTGLGLSICKSIVEEFGGHIHLTSAEGDGAVFIIDLPKTTL